MRIVIGEGSCGIATGAQKVRSALEALITEPIGSTGCIGMCYLEPIVDLYEGKELVRRLVRVSDKDAEAIAEAVKTGDLSKVDAITILPEDEDFLKSIKTGEKNRNHIDNILERAKLLDALYASSEKKGEVVF